MSKKALFYRIFLPYCLLLTAVLFLRSADGLGIGIEAVSQRLRESVNLTPFRTVRSYHKAFSCGSMSFQTYFLNIYGNALLFMPMGIMMPKLFGFARSFLRCVMLLLVMILSAELLQLIMGIGRADIDDVILNFAGALFGRTVMHSRTQDN